MLLTHDRSDVHVKYEVYFIDSTKMAKFQSIDVYFSITLSCYNDIGNVCHTSLKSSINEFGNDSNSNVQMQFCPIYENV